MFGLFKAKNPYEQEALTVYSALLDRACLPVFYEEYGVKDSFDGRFDLLCLHVFMVMHVVLLQEADAEFNQALFDAMFIDMDQALRESGKGDMGVPKHMRRMMKGFNGRMNSYQEAYGDDQEFEEALVRNLYAGADVGGAHVEKMMAYVRDNVSGLTAQGAEHIIKGELTLAGFPKEAK